MHSKKLYQKYSVGRHWEKHSTIYSETFAEFLKYTNFKGTIVDIGCGNARDVNFFSKHGFNILGVDNSKEGIENNKKKFSKLKFEIQNAENLKFKDNSVDAFFMINVIHYVDKEKTIQEIFRTLRPNGYIFIHFNIDIIDKNGKIDYRYDQENILRLISKFKIIKQQLFKRVDSMPIKHTHKIMELILQKP
jgi:ubiquinone/menaquinone biosynthesis C-methylase UbiE